jgi:hypothetical protein
MLIHGGSQMAYNDQWSAKFSVQAWAGQGYMCVNLLLFCFVWYRNITNITILECGYRTLQVPPGSGRSSSMQSQAMGVALLSSICGLAGQSC